MTNEELAALGRDLPDGAPTRARREAMRTSLIALAQNTAPEQPRRRRTLLVGGLALAVAAGIALWLGLRATSIDHAVTVQRVASVQAPEGARFVHTSTPVGDGGVDEVVRLDTGRVTVAVEKLRPGERFRVIAGDAEVEVRGTSFDVRVEDDALMEVVVHTGAVEVRPAGRPTVLLHPGERWTREVAISDPARDVVVAVVPPVMETPAPAAGPYLHSGGSTPLRAPRSASRTTNETPLRAPRSASRTTNDTFALSREARSAERVEGPRSLPETPAPTPPPPAQVLPPTIEAEFAAGWAAVRASDHLAAAAHFAAAIAAAPDAALAEDARYWRAVSLAKARRTTEAARAMSAFLAAHPRSSRAGEIAVMLGWIELERNQPRAARRHFGAGLSDPSEQVRSSAQAGVRALDGQ